MSGRASSDALDDARQAIGELRRWMRHGATLDVRWALELLQREARQQADGVPEYARVEVDHDLETAKRWLQLVENVRAAVVALVPIAKLVGADAKPLHAVAMRMRRAAGGEVVEDAPQLFDACELVIEELAPCEAEVKEKPAAEEAAGREWLSATDVQKLWPEHFPHLKAVERRCKAWGITSTSRKNADGRPAKRGRLYDKAAITAKMREIEDATEKRIDGFRDRHYSIWKDKEQERKALTGN